jgi:hypothetical protein
MNEPAVSEQPPPGKNVPPPRKAGIATLLLHHSITVLILILLLGLGVWSYLNFQHADFFATVDRQALRTHIEPPLIEAQQQRITNAIEVSTLLNNRPPPALDDLVDQGLLLPSDLYYPRANPLWHYERHPEGYALRFVGDETDDDEIIEQD